MDDQQAVNVVIIFSVQVVCSDFCDIFCLSFNCDASIARVSVLEDVPVVIFLSVFRTTEDAIDFYRGWEVEGWDYGKDCEDLMEF